MAFMEWRREYSVGIENMDEEHRGLFELVNELHTAVTDGLDERVIRERLVALYRAGRHHFASEEGFLLLRQYPGYAVHNREHERLNVRLTEFREAVAAENVETASMVLEFVRAWLVGHITHEDRRYGDYFAGVKVLQPA